MEKPKHTLRKSERLDVRERELECLVGKEREDRVKRKRMKRGANRKRLRRKISLAGYKT